MQTSIDRFILARLDAIGRKPAPAADRRTLLRRLTFGLTGLPPSYGEIKAFEQDTSPARSRPSLTACSHRPLTASTGDGTGWTSFAMPTRPAKRPTIPCRRRGVTETT